VQLTWFSFKPCSSHCRRSPTWEQLYFSHQSTLYRTKSTNSSVTHHTEKPTYFFIRLKSKENSLAISMKKKSKKFEVGLSGLKKWTYGRIV